MRKQFSSIWVVPGRHYYGRHGAGTVVLINGAVAYHATGKRCAHDAKDFVRTCVQNRRERGASWEVIRMSKLPLIRNHELASSNKVTVRDISQEFAAA